VRQAPRGIDFKQPYRALPGLDYFLNVKRAATTFSLPFAPAHLGPTAVSIDELDTRDLQGAAIVGSSLKESPRSGDHGEKPAPSSASEVTCALRLLFAWPWRS
jgi:hypothetical protein